MNHKARRFRVRMIAFCSVMISTADGLNTEKPSSPGIGVRVGIAVFVGVRVAGD
jgi:hypothetical protein